MVASVGRAVGSQIARWDNKKGRAVPRLLVKLRRSLVKEQIPRLLSKSWPVVERIVPCLTKAMVAQTFLVDAAVTPKVTDFCTAFFVLHSVFQKDASILQTQPSSDQANT